MATNAVPVTADQKDEPGVKETQAYVDGIGNLTVYVKVSTTDDLDQKTTEDVQTLKLSVPVEEEEEVEELDAEGDPIKNEDGSTKLKVEKYYKTVHYEVDLGKVSRDKLEKALAPFLKNAREAQAPVIRGSQSTLTATPSKSAHDLTAIREWAKGAGHSVKEKGRIAGDIIAAYYRSTGKTNPEA
ncbi:histone-like nucleoid-structuring protein Lsr2 [Streptomyces turgidiscabies]|uniref:Lsr2 family DNA-binding protein n=1 Tax=Streptomyces turgidiscabies TaxID=85558 RepID=UPI0038F7DFCC